MKKQSDQIRALIRSILLEDAAAAQKGPEFYTTARGEEFRVPTFSTKTVPRAPDDEESEAPEPEPDDAQQPEKSKPENLSTKTRDPFQFSTGATASISATSDASPTPAPTSTGSGARTRLPAGVVISNPAAAGIKFTTLYDAPRPGRLHKGIDIVYEDGNILGEDVYAIRAGQVIDFSNVPRDGRGKYVTIKHGIEGESTYMHLSELESTISKGDGVAAGGRIGAVGNTGSSSGPHLHLETKDEKGDYVDPLVYLNKKPMKLIFPVPAIEPKP